jgi:hypothetical protein
MGYLGKEKGRVVWGGEVEKENKRTQMASPPKGSQSEFDCSKCIYVHIDLIVN